MEIAAIKIPEAPAPFGIEAQHHPDEFILHLGENKAGERLPRSLFDRRR